MFLLILIPGLLIDGWTVYFNSYWQMESALNNKWGFALDEGHPYTAPVWMGEFGEVARGNYWLHMMRYLAARDVDFAFWAFNGKAYKDAWMNIENANPWGLLTGTLNGRFESQPRKWEEETWGLMHDDYTTLRRPWVLQDLQVLMQSRSPVNPYPCQRAVLGSRCGG